MERAQPVPPRHRDRAPPHRRDGKLMDPATMIGVIGAFLVVIIANVLEGGSPMSLILFAPMLLVFGATLLICLAGGTMGDAKLSFRALVKGFTSPAPSAAQLVPELVTLADKARREGLLALEDYVSD